MEDSRASLGENTSPKEIRLVKEGNTATLNTTHAGRVFQQGKDAIERQQRRQQLRKTSNNIFVVGGRMGSQGVISPALDGNKTPPNFEKMSERSSINRIEL